MTYEEKMRYLSALGDLQSEMAGKTRYYKAKSNIELMLRFERASFAAMNARIFIQAALMAEREAEAREVVG